MMSVTYMTSTNGKRSQDVRTAHRQQKRSTFDPSSMGDKLKAEFKKLKGNDDTQGKYVEAGKTWI